MEGESRRHGWGRKNVKHKGIYQGKERPSYGPYSTFSLGNFNTGDDSFILISLCLWLLWLYHILVFYFPISPSLFALATVCATDSLSYLSLQSQDLIYNSLLTIFTWMSWRHFKNNLFNIDLTNSPFPLDVLVAISPCQMFFLLIILVNRISIFSISQDGLPWLGKESCLAHS